MLFYDGHKVYMDGSYPAIYLNGKNQHVHRLEWIKHFGEIKKGYVIHHKNENKLDWSIDNLELLTKSNHIKKHKDIVRRKGIPTVAIKDGRVLKFNSIKEAAEKCGTYPMSIQRIFNGKQYYANGWTFERG